MKLPDPFVVFDWTFFFGIELFLGWVTGAYHLLDLFPEMRLAYDTIAVLVMMALAALVTFAIRRPMRWLDRLTKYTIFHK